MRCRSKDSNLAIPAARMNTPATGVAYGNAEVEKLQATEVRLALSEGNE
ncbi:MAG: hypothetical protein NVS3B14_00500 [Ktedonobacteraceae bacterium]